MPKGLDAPSLNWNVQDQYEQAKIYNKQAEENRKKKLQQEQEFNALAEKEAKAWKKLKKYEEDGYDMSMHYDKFKTIGAKDNQLERAYKGFRKFTSEGATTLSNMFGVDDSQYRNNLNQIRISENNWKQNQADTKQNKYKTKEDVWNVSGGFGEVLPYIAGGVAMGASKAPTLGGKIIGDVGRGAVSDAYLASLQHGYKDNFDEQLAKEVGLGVVGQAAGTGIAHLLSKIGGNAKVQTDIQPIVKQQDPIGNNKTLTDNDIASKINAANFGETSKPTLTEAEINLRNEQLNSGQVNDFFNPVDTNRIQAQGNGKPQTIQSKLPDVLPTNPDEFKEVMQYAIKNDAIDEFISKLPKGAKIDKVQEFFNNLKPVQPKQDGIIPVTINKKEPIKNYNIDMLNEFEGLTKATGNNTADVLNLENFTNTQGVRNSIDRYIKGTATQRDYEILDSIENFMKYEGDNFRNMVEQPTYKPNMKVDDAVANNIDFDTANKMGAIPFSNGSQTFGGGAVGGLESEFNQRDYNNDGKHDYKDNLIGLIIGAVGVNAAKKIMPKAFKDGNIDKNTNGMFVGAKPTDEGAFSDVATKKVMREIDDSKAKFELPDRTKKDVSWQLNMQHLPDEDIKDYMDLDGFKGTKQEYIEAKRKEGYDELYDITKEDYALQEILDHPTLFKQYPELKNVNVKFFNGRDGWNPHGEGSFHNGEIKLKINEPEKMKSVVLHEIQHAIQNKEGWARGGNVDYFDNLKVNKNIEAKELEYKIDRFERELEVEAEILLRKNKEDALAKADKWAKENDYPNSMFTDDKDKVASYLIDTNKTFKDMYKRMSDLKYGDRESSFDKYKRLWGEQQARATQQRMKYTPEQRASEDWTKTLANNEGKYNEPIIKYDDGVAMSEQKLGFLERKKAEVQAKIDSGEIPERGRTVVSPYDNGKQYYLGESGKVYFQRGNGTWRETENFDTVKDVKYVAENGLSNFKKMQGEEDLRFEKAMKESKLREEESSKSYKMSHKAPTKDNGVSANDITDMFSKDIYSKDAARLFGHGSTKMDNESISLINKVRNKPDAEVTIYRAVPKDLDVKINPDDWVTTSKEYAKVHGDGPLKGNYKILEMKVKAKDLYTDGNSIHEWGWSPNKSMDGMIAMSSPTLSGGIVGGVAGATNDLDGDGKITYKDILYGALGGAGATKGVLLAKNTKAISKSKELVKKIGDTDLADAFLGHKIYAKKDYMSLREKMITSKNIQMENFSQLHEQLKLLDDNTRESMYKYMTGNTDVKLPSNVKSLADNFRNKIDNLSQELVDLGVLDKAQAEKYKGRYLHRSYEKDLTKNISQMFGKGKTINGVYTRGKEWTGTQSEYNKLLANGDIGDFFDGKIEATKLNNGKYKFRQDWTDEQRAKWGEINDIAYALPETLMRTNEMVEHAKLLKNVVNETNLVLDEAIDGYVQLNGKKYGALNGKYVPKDVASDIDEFHNAVFGNDGNKYVSKEVVDNFKMLSTFWKKTHTVYNPIAHFNNLMSNVTMQFGAGINPAVAIKNATKGAFTAQKVKQLRELAAKELVGLSDEESKSLALLKQDEDLALWMDAQKKGLFGRSGLNDILSQYVNPTQISGKFKGTKKALKKIDDVASAMYQGEDNIMRFSMLKSLTEQGKTLDEAIKEINNTIPDYTKPMSRLARFGRNSMLTPFISWTYYSTPIILKQAKERPERIAALFGSLYGINQLMGIDPYDEKDIPQQNFSMKRIPIYKDGNEVTTIKVDRWIPHNDLLNPNDFIKNLTSGGAWTPISDIPRNRHSYFGGKITHREGVGKAYDLTKYGVQQITPDIVDNAWNLAESKILSKKQRTKNPVIQPRTTTQELLKNLGINVMTYDKANQRKKVINEKLK